MGFSGPKNGRDTPSKNWAKLLIVDGGKIRNAVVNRLILRVGALSNVQSVAVISIDLEGEMLSTIYHWRCHGNGVE
jgi:hypothetical protein